jgi:magnesium transporter
MADLSELARDRDLKGLKQWLSEHGAIDIAGESTRLDLEERAVVFRLLSKDRALDVFEALDPVHQQELLASLRESNVREILEEMDPDDRARLLDEMPAAVAKRLLEGLSPHERKLTSILLGYPENSTGRIMSPEYISLRASMTVEEALAFVRKAGREAETIYTLPVTDDELCLMGVAGLRELVLAAPQDRVRSIMTQEVYSARADEDQEQAARLMKEAGILAMPVTDTEGRLVGVLTIDDAMEVLEAEDTEDILRGGGSEPLGRPYLTVSTLYLARTRATWLLILIIASTLTVNVLQYFEVALQTVVTLSLFIPLLIGMGGNVGAQSATIVVRAMAIGEVRPTDFARVVLREVRVGALLGLMIGFIAYFPVMIIFGFQFGNVISLSLFSISTLAAMVGSVLPLLAKRVGVDPAVVSAPIITTLVDATGLIIYFLIAGALLGLQLTGGL